MAFLILQVRAHIFFLALSSLAFHLEDVCAVGTVPVGTEVVCVCARLTWIVAGAASSARRNLRERACDSLTPTILDVKKGKEFSQSRHRVQDGRKERDVHIQRIRRKTPSEIIRRKRRMSMLESQGSRASRIFEKFKAAHQSTRFSQCHFHLGHLTAAPQSESTRIHSEVSL